MPHTVPEGLRGRFWIAPWAGGVEAAGDVSNATFNLYGPAASTGYLGVKGSLLEYKITELHASFSATATLQITDGASAVTPSFRLLPGATHMEFSGPGVALGEGKIPHVTIAVTGGEGDIKVLARGTVQARRT